MAEEFNETIEKLGQATKSPTQVKSKKVLAVQVVDSVGRRPQRKDEGAQLNALQDLETSFPDQFEEILSKKGPKGFLTVAESAKLKHEALLNDIKIGVDGMKLTLVQRFKDSFTNLFGLMPDNAARKRAKAADLATKLMQADIRDLADTLTEGQERQKVQFSSRGFLAKLFGPKKGAAAEEREREKLRRDKKMLRLVGQIAKVLGVSDLGDKKKEKEGKKGGLLSMLKLALPAGAIGGFLGKTIGPAALLAGLALVIRDGFEGWFKSEEWGVSKFSGVIGGIFGGADEGLKGALWGGMKWALLGAGIGSVFPVIGTILGGVIGALFGALLGFIGGKKIAKFVDKTGEWLSERWEEIKAFPGKIWQAIVDTLKGWLGLTKEQKTVPPIKTDPKEGPQEGWLMKLIKFLYPKWLIDFAKDAVGTVAGWLGLTKKDDQGKTVETDVGKKVFGITGKISDVLGNVWDFYTGIIKRIITEPVYNAIVGFAKNPVDYILTNVLGWKDAEGKATKKGIAAIEFLDKASFKDIVKTVFKAIIEGVETAILNKIKKVKETYTDIKSKIPTMEEIKEILPEWMTDPIAVLKRLIKQLSKYLPTWMGGDPSEEQLRRKAERLAIAAGTKDIQATEGFEKLDQANQQRMKQLRAALAEFRTLRKGGDLRSGGAKTFEEYLMMGTGRYASRFRGSRPMLPLNAEKQQAFLKENKMFLDFLKHATTQSPSRSIFTHDTGLHKRLDRIFPPTEAGQRAAAMTQANILKSVDGLRQTAVQSPVVMQNNSPITTTVTNHQGRMARAPIDMVSGL